MESEKKLKNKKTLNFMQYLNQNMDIVFNSWPYSTTPMKLKIPYLFIPHDFIFTHYFGHHVGNVYNRKWWQDCRNLIQGYLDFDCIPCTTTKYIANELKRTFPQYKGDINTVLIVPNNNMKKMSHEQISEIMARLEVKGDYILLATNDFHHKNTEEALTAYYYVKQKYPDLKMIIVGYGTEGVYVKMNCPYYADHVSDNEDYDIKSLGLVSNEEINALIQNARILLNVSLCEAACGSGQDAWFLDTPTVISDIPPYLEQVKILGVKTEFVNPKNSEDIAKHILFLLDNPDKALENAKVSEQALKTVYTEKDMADNYMTVFKKYIRSIH